MKKKFTVGKGPTEWEKDWPVVSDGEKAIAIFGTKEEAQAYANWRNAPQHEISWYVFKRLTRRLLKK